VDTESVDMGSVYRLIKCVYVLGDRGQVADICECGNEPSCSTKCDEYLQWLRTD
jgi:hypothetical protein